MRRASFGEYLPAWLDRLDAEGFRVGVRERLVVHQFLVRLIAEGNDLTPTKALPLLASIICTSPESQRRYSTLLTEFLRTAQAAPARADRTTAASKRQPTRGAIAAALTLAAVALSLMWLTPMRSIRIAPEQRAQPGFSIPEPGEVSDPIYVARKGLAFERRTSAEPPPTGHWKGLAIGVAIAGIGLGLASMRRRQNLANVRTDQAVRAHVLSSAEPERLEATPTPLRAAARGLRQRVAGQRLVFDVRATSAATIRAGGALAPRFRAAQTTPEYLALIDRRAPNDHVSVMAEEMIRSLTERDVSVQRFHFNGSPNLGCWRLRASGDDSTAFDRSSLAELAARYEGCRLLVFGDPGVLVDSFTGAPHRWVRELRSFPERAWFSPMPIASWGAGENAADSLGFLVLPTQFEALSTLAGWLSADSLTLATGDWPVAYPPLLMEGGLTWVTREIPPSGTAPKDLVRQLRNYLGHARFQWLCACAIFPGIAPQLTLPLGRLFVDNPNDLAIGVSAIGALPWFRHGHMPGWVRQTLLAELEPAHAARAKRVVEERLAAALTDGSGTSFATIHTPDRIRAWLQRGTGVARDVVMAEFLTRGAPQSLALQLPRELRSRLFRSGVPGLGLRTEISALIVVLLASIVALFFYRIDRMPTSRPSIGDPVAIATISEPGVEFTFAAFSADGSRIAAASSDGAVRIWKGDGSGKPMRLQGHTGPSTHVAFSPDDLRIVSGSVDATARVWDLVGDAEPIVLAGSDGPLWKVLFSHDGRRVFASNADHAARIWYLRDPNASTNSARIRLQDGVPLATFEFDGRRIVTASGDNTVRVWELNDRAPPTGAIVLTGHTSWITSAAFSADGRLLVTASGDGTARVWDLDDADPSGSAVVLEGHEAPVTSAAFSADGRRVVTASGDNTARVWDLDDSDPSTSAIVLRGYRYQFLSASLSPDGSRVLTARQDGAVQIWGSAFRKRVELVRCYSRAGASPSARAIAGTLADLQPQSDPVEAGQPTGGFDVVVYASAVWRALRQADLPEPGAIRYTREDNEQRITAEAILKIINSWPLAGGVKWYLDPADVALPAVVVNICDFERMREAKESVKQKPLDRGPTKK